MVERWSGGVVEWWSGGVVEWWSGGVVEWWSGEVGVLGSIADRLVVYTLDPEHFSARLGRAGGLTILDYLVKLFRG